MVRKYLRGLAWGFYFLGAVLLTLTFMPGLAQGSAELQVSAAKPSATPEPQLNISHVDCAGNGQVLFHFVLVHWHGPNPPGQVDFTVNGSQYTAPEWKITGDTVHYVGYVPVNPEGVYDLTAANAGPYTLHNPQTFNRNCGSSTPTNTPTNTPVPPTDTPTNTPVPPTDTPTNTPVPPTDTPTNTAVPPTDTPTNTPTESHGSNPTATPTQTQVHVNVPTNTPIPSTVTPTTDPCITNPSGPGCATATPVALLPVTGQQTAGFAMSRMQTLGAFGLGLIFFGFALQWISYRGNRQA